MNKVHGINVTQKIITLNNYMQRIWVMEVEREWCKLWECVYECDLCTQETFINIIAVVYTDLYVCMYVVLTNVVKGVHEGKWCK